MKRVCLILLCVLLLTGCAVNAPASQTRTLSLGNSWTDVFLIDNTSQNPIIVQSGDDPEEPVMVRIVSRDLIRILVDEVTIHPGGSHTFSFVTTDGCIIQAKSADDTPRTYTLTYTLGNAH